MRKSQLIDLVRSFNILSVLAIHCSILLRHPDAAWAAWLWQHFQRNGVYGVYLFFGVSGFLITGVIAKSPGGLFRPSFKTFYLQRAGRILPLLVVGIWIGILSLFIGTPTSIHHLDVFHPEVGQLNAAFWACVATFTFNWFLALHQPSAYGLFWNVLWSLSVEEQFYLFFPMSLRRLANPRNLNWFLGFFLLLGPLWRLGCYFWAPNSRFLQISASFGAFDSIAFGVLLYGVNEKWESLLKKDLGRSASLCGIGALLSIGTYFMTDLGSLDQIFAPTLLGLGLLLFLLGGLNLSFFENKYLKPLSWPGRYCYGGYLLHPMVLSVIFPLLYGMEAWAGFFFFAVVTTAVSALSYHFFEMPANRTVRALGKTQ